MRTILYILTFLTSTAAYCQIRNSDSEKAKLLVDNFADHVDSLTKLTNGYQLYYVSDSVFKCIILTTSSGEKIELDLRYKDNFRGYTELGADFEKYVLIKHRGDGSGNPEELRVIDKQTGKVSWLGNYPFYLDKYKEVAVYKAYTVTASHFVVHDFASNKMETYPIPDTKCICCSCWEMIQFDQQGFTIRYLDPDNNMTEIKLERK